MSAPADGLRRRLAGVESGELEPDLSPDARAAVTRLLRMALNVLETFGGTPAEDMARMMRDPQEPPEVNDRVAALLRAHLPNRDAAK